MFDCKICNKEFMSSRTLTNHIKKEHNISLEEYYIKYISKGEHICPVCMKPNKFRNMFKGFTVFCSDKCRYSVEGKKHSNTISKKTSLERYGVDNYSKTDECKEKIKITSLDKYGVDHYSKTVDFVEDVKKTSLERYGVDNYSKTDECKEKVVKSFLNNYSCENVFQNEIIKENIKKSNLIEYGVEYYNQTEKSKKQHKETSLERYGVDNYSKTDECKDKVKETSLERYGVEYYRLTDEYDSRSKITRRKKYWNRYKLLLKNKKIEVLFDKEYYINNDYNFKFKCNKCNKEFSIDKYRPIQNIYCSSCLLSISKEEVEVLDYIKSLNIKNIESNKRFILDKEEKELYNKSSLELDIYLPDLNIGIEYDGVYWHSELHKENDYHLNKTEYFKSKGIDLIHIFSTEWNDKQDIVKSIIKNKLGLNSNRIYARKCIIKEISNKEYKEFLDENHIQGSVNSKIKIGLYFEDELVSCIGVGKSRFTNEYELYRYVNKKGYSIVGGFSKLIKYLNNYSIYHLETYCDRRYFNGNGYEKVGFIFNSYTKPGYFYIKGKTLYNRMNFMKHKLEGKLKIFDSNLTEHENMLNNGYNRIYDCGNIKYIMKTI